MMTPKERAIWLKFRRGFLMVNDALEELLEVGRYEPPESSFGDRLVLRPEDAPLPRQRDDARYRNARNAAGKPRP